jgi:hypothetical protein
VPLVPRLKPAAPLALLAVELEPDTAMMSTTVPVPTDDDAEDPAASSVIDIVPDAELTAGALPDSTMVWAIVPVAAVAVAEVPLSGESVPIVPVALATVAENPSSSNTVPTTGAGITGRPGPCHILLAPVIGVPS